MRKSGLTLGRRGNPARSLLPLALLLAGPVALACTIDQARDFQEGVHKGVRGVCSNNGLEISCVEEDGRDYTCSGPEGGFRGSDLATAVFSACGCGNE